MGKVTARLTAGETAREISVKRREIPLWAEAMTI